MAMSTNENNNEEIVAEINMTPLIDVMLVLLIILMVTSTAAIESGLDVTLPRTKETVSKENKEMVVVSLNSLGEIAVQGVKVARENLKASIAQKLTELKTEDVIFEGDIESKLGNAVEIMDIAKEAGAKNFSLAAEKIEETIPHKGA